MSHLGTLPAVRPEVGKIYYLRAGLTALITDALEIYGHRFWRGMILDPAPAINVWYGSGAYSPVDRVQHELDIVWEKS